MKDKIILQLKAKYPGAKNLSQARLDVIADKLSSKITDENQIDAELEYQNSIHPFEEIAKYDDYLRAKEAKDKKPKPVDNQKPADDQKPTTEPELPKALQEALAKIEKFQRDQVQSDLRGKLLNKLKGEKIPLASVLAQAVSLETEEDVETRFSEIKQSYTNDGFAQMPKPQGGAFTSVKPDVAEAEIKEWAERNKKPANAKV